MNQQSISAGLPRGRSEGRGMDPSRFVHPIAPGDYVQSLDKGLSVIKAFNSDRRTMTLTEVAEATGLSKPSARRFLLTLQALGYVSQEDGRFRLRPRVLDLGGSYLTSGELPALVNPYLSELNAKLREACSVGVLDGDNAVYIARASAQQRIMTFNVQVGTRIDPVITALGRVLLANLPPAVLQAYLQRRQQFAPAPQIPPDGGFTDDLDRIREQGWCLMDQEIEVGVRTIAAPLRNSAGTVIAGINVAAHTARVSLERLQDEFLPELLDTQARIEKDLAEYGPDMLG